MLKTVLFDLDGVITDSAQYHYEAWKMLADRLHIPFDEEYNEKLKGVSRMESLDLILQHGNVQEKYTLQEKEKMAQDKNDFYKELIQKITPDDTLPGILPFLAELKQAGITTGVASVSKNAFTIIDRLALNSSFNVIVDAAKVKRAKPFPDIFLEGARALGSKPEECIGIEDAKAGVEAIKRAGMKAVGVGTKSEMQQADLILPGTEELSLARILAELFPE